MYDVRNLFAKIFKLYIILYVNYIFSELNTYEIYFSCNIKVNILQSNYSAERHFAQDELMIIFFIQDSKKIYS